MYSLSEEYINLNGDFRLCSIYDWLAWSVTSVSNSDGELFHVRRGSVTRLRRRCAITRTILEHSEDARDARATNRPIRDKVVCCICYLISMECGISSACIEYYNISALLVSAFFSVNTKVRILRFKMWTENKWNANVNWHFLRDKVGFRQDARANRDLHIHGVCSNRWFDENGVTRKVPLPYHNNN